MSITPITNFMLRAAFIITITLPSSAYSAIIDFNFTGNVTVIANAGNFNPAPFANTDEFGDPIWRTPISASLKYNTETGFGNSALSITMSNFIGSSAILHDIELKHEKGSNIINGLIYVDWNGILNMPMHIEWDATGLLNALTYDLKPGDTISGSTLKQDTNGDGDFDTYSDVLSATPYSDLETLWDFVASPPPPPLEGPAPLAATSNSRGMGYDINGNYLTFTPLPGVAGLINIGSGDSLTVASVSAVPLPAAVWMFSFGLIGLFGVARHK